MCERRRPAVPRCQRASRVCAHERGRAAVHARREDVEPCARARHDCCSSAVKRQAGKIKGRSPWSASPSLSFFLRPIAPVSRSSPCFLLCSPCPSLSLSSSLFRVTAAAHEDDVCGSAGHSAAFPPLSAGGEWPTTKVRASSARGGRGAGEGQGGRRTEDKDRDRDKGQGEGRRRRTSRTTKSSARCEKTGETAALGHREAPGTGKRCKRALAAFHGTDPSGIAPSCRQLTRAPGAPRRVPDGHARSSLGVLQVCIQRAAAENGPCQGPADRALRRGHQMAPPRPAAQAGRDAGARAPHTHMCLRVACQRAAH